ncbi:MAG: efflux RND transporter permease subunit [Kofleriaceae bacterium]|nr:efflux RND transporter permease subunit [Kofleriaceae bacterium]
MRAHLLAVLALLACSDLPKSTPKPRAIVSISTGLVGGSARDVEDRVVEPIEHAVGQIEGVAEITSRVDGSTAMVVVTPVAGRDIHELTRATQKALERMYRQLPAEVEPPAVRMLPGNDAPIMTLVIESERLSRTELSEIVDVVVRRELESLAGVGSIETHGVSVPALFVRPDPQKLAAYGLTVVDVTTALQRQNVAIPGGRVDATAQNMQNRISGQSLDVETTGAMLVGPHGHAPVYLRDFATVEVGPETPPDRATPRLDLHAQLGASHDDVRARVREKVAALGLPAGVKVVEVATEHPPSTELVASIRGPDRAVLVQLTEGLGDELRADGVVLDPPSSKSEQVIEIDRDRAAMLGISVGDIAATIRAGAGSQRIGEARLDGKLRSLVMQMPSAPPTQVLTLSVRRSDGRLVTLADLVTLRMATSSPLLRHDRERAIDLRAPATAVAKARKRVAQEAAKWPPGYRAVVPR